ncbi:MAG: hypothetical protein A2Y40_02140 [Candidatus Margulisbacteria bacterium GWF2_35_9]|nr:MAG: hypothetical protein A2Y40_02140 [Candidatus Margulisbacteria bacterium GWF2_35_9]
MKKVCIIFITIFLISICFSSEKKEIINLKNGKQVILNDNYTWSYYVPDPRDKDVTFKSLKFGATLKEFYKEFAAQKKSVKSMPNDGVYYFDYDFGYEPAILMFYFKDDMFYKGEAIIKVAPPDQENYVDRYLKIKKLLTSLYGKATGGTALSTEWDFTRYTVNLAFTKDGGRLSLKALYNIKEQNQISTDSKEESIHDDATVIESPTIEEPIINDPMPELDKNIEELDLKKMRELIHNIDS